MADFEISLHLWVGELDSKVKWKRRRQILGFIFYSRHMAGNVDKCRRAQSLNERKKLRVALDYSSEYKPTSRSSDLFSYDTSNMKRSVMLRNSKTYNFVTSRFDDISLM
jgi:hypothetical protein